MMYQEWESPPFESVRLSEICREFFEARNFHTEVVNSSSKMLVEVQISQINLTEVLIIESKGRKIRLTFPAPSHASDGLMRLGGLLVTGRTFKTGSERDLFLSSLEQQFWEYLDKELGK